MTAWNTQADLQFVGGLMGINTLHMPSDDEVAALGDDEQKAIDYSILHGLKTVGCTHSTLAMQSKMNKSQFSQLWSGTRGVPMKRFLPFVRATGTLMMLKFYAFNVGCVLTTKQEHDDREREINQLKARVAELESSDTKLKQWTTPRAEVA